MYANKVNGSSKPGEFLGRDLDFYTLATSVNILTASTSGGNGALSGSSTTQAKLDKLVEVIALKAGQPVIMGTPTTSDGVTYTVKFASEHTGGTDGATLVSDLVAAQTNGMGFLANNTTVTIALGL